MFLHIFKQHRQMFAIFAPIRAETSPKLFGNFKDLFSFPPYFLGATLSRKILPNIEHLKKMFAFLLIRVPKTFHVQCVSI